MENKMKKCIQILSVVFLTFQYNTASSQPTTISQEHIDSALKSIKPKYRSQSCPLLGKSYKSVESFPEESLNTNLLVELGDQFVGGEDQFDIEFDISTKNLYIIEQELFVSLKYYKQAIIATHNTQTKNDIFDQMKNVVNMMIDLLCKISHEESKTDAKKLIHKARSKLDKLMDE
jgi:hypothetical protein